MPRVVYTTALTIGVAPRSLMLKEGRSPGLLLLLFLSCFASCLVVVVDVGDEPSLLVYVLMAIDGVLKDVSDVCWGISVVGARSVLLVA